MVLCDKNDILTAVVDQAVKFITCCKTFDSSRVYFIVTFLSSSGQDLVELLQEYFIEINTEWLEQHFESDHQKFSVVYS
ncbi:unnamed protein product [Rhizophagus irregularis]|nr:unnamed protein product [Rhizophagus irregularis]